MWGTMEGGQGLPKTLSVAIPKKNAAPAPLHNTACRFELAIWSLVSSLGLYRLGECRSMMWVCTGYSSSLLVPPGASTS